MIDIVYLKLKQILNNKEICSHGKVFWTAAYPIHLLSDIFTINLYDIAQGQKSSSQFSCCVVSSNVSFSIYLNRLNLNWNFNLKSNYINHLQLYINSKKWKYIKQTNID